MRYLFVLVLPFLPVLHAQVDPSLLNNVTQAFSQAQIVPTVLPSFTPTDLVNITFTATTPADRINVIPGSLLLENQTAMEPMFSLIQNDTTTLMGNETFVLALVDPDVSSPQGTGMTEFLQFLGANFSVDPSSNLVNQSAALFEWFSPSPPAGDPPHRYVLVVYQQPDNFSDVVSTLVNASTQRLGFDFLSFTNAANLTSPLAGNYFLVGPDNSTSTTTTASATPSATLSSATSQLTSSLTAPTSSSAPATSNVIVTSTSTAPIPSDTTTTATTSSAFGYPESAIGSISFLILVLARELFM